jgi:hypothetical protein
MQRLGERRGVVEGIWHLAIERGGKLRNADTTGEERTNASMREDAPIDNPPSKLRGGV